MTVVYLLLSLLVVTVGAEAMVRGATLLALRMGVSPLFVGLTIVGFGTSSPELAASMAATIRGSLAVSVGNVVGSNIFNIGVIVGLAACIYPLRVQLSAVKRDLMVALAAATVPWSGLLWDRRLPAAWGGLLVAALAIYLGVAYRNARRTDAGDADLVRREVHDTLEPVPTRLGFMGATWVNVGLVIGGLILLVLGARTFVTAAVALAQSLGVSELVIGLTIVAAGTSLPELMTSVVAAVRRSPDLAIGNIIGSNIFNMFGILGACAVVRPQTIEARVLYLDAPVMVVATLALLPIMKSGGAISRVEGAFLLLGYGLYLGATLLFAA